MQTGYLARAGRFRVEHLPCPGPAGALVGTDRPKGVLHTTEGSFESALAIFRERDAPTFLLGRDKHGRVRVVQLRPLGACAAALEHPAGTPETNRAVMAQVEIAGYSQRKPWLPDDEVTEALATLMLTLEDAAGIPLRHPVISDRDERAFARASGWVGHCDVPNNSHWDPGALRWAALFKRAKQLDATPAVVKARPRRVDVLVNGRLRLRAQKPGNPAVLKRLGGWIRTANVTVKGSK